MVDACHGSLNVPIEHHPTIRYMVYNGYYKVMSNIPKMGQLPTPACVPHFFRRTSWLPSCPLQFLHSQCLWDDRVAAVEARRW